MVELNLQIQQYQQVAQTQKGNSFVTGCASARIRSMLFRLTMMKKVLLMYLIVHYESLILMFMLCYIYRILFPSLLHIY